MTRKELLETEEYPVAIVECIIRSGKPIKSMREEMVNFIKKYTAEMIELNTPKKIEDGK